MGRNHSAGGRIGGQFFPKALAVVGTGTLMLWLLAAWGAVKPTAVHFGDVHNHFHAPAVPVRPADDLPQTPDAPIVIHTPPPQVFIRGDGDPQRTGRIVQAELEARQQVVEAARDELAGELKGRGRLTQADLVRSYHQGVERIYGPRSQAPAQQRQGVVKVTRALGSPTDGWWVSDCEGAEEAMPLSEKFPELY